MWVSVKKSDHMGTMSLEMYKQIVDQAAGNIEFLSLASRGEPLVCKDFEGMMEYSVGKFLNLKVNTNASLLTENIVMDYYVAEQKQLYFQRMPLKSHFTANSEYVVN